MKSFKSLFLTCVAALALIIPSFGATVTFDGTTTTAKSLVSNRSLLLTSITFQNNNTSTGAVAFAFFSAPTNVTSQVFAAYTNSTVSAQTTTTIITNIYGRLQTNASATVTTALGVVSSITNSYPKLYSYTAAGGPATTTVTLSPPLVFMQGLCITNSLTNCTFTATYTPGF